MQKLCRESGTSLIWITHDLSVVAGLADTVSVMYAGRIVEAGPVADVLEAPRHPYTAGLIASTPAAAVRLGQARGQPLSQIPGMTPSLLRLAGGLRLQASAAAAPPTSARPSRRSSPTRAALPSAASIRSAPTAWRPNA